MIHRFTWCAILALLGCAPTHLLAQSRPMQIEDLFRFQRVADPQLSPDGTQVVYQVTAVDLGENKSVTNLWIAATDGKTPPRKLTTATKSDRHPRWSPDGKQILFESNRSGENQLWVIDVSGGEARQLTTISTGASNGTWSRDGSQIAFVSAVFPQNSDKPFAEADQLNKKKLQETSSSPVKARVFTRLFFRHWDEYVEDKRQHLFVIPAKGGEPKNLTPGDRDAYPTSNTFSVGDEFVFSPNGKSLIFTAVPDRDEAWSTNYEVCRVPITGGKIDTLTTANTAADGCPRFSPDGKHLAYRAQKRTGYEADKWDVMVVETNDEGVVVGKPRNVTASLDRSADSFSWGDNKRIYFHGDHEGGTGIFTTTIDDAKPTLFSAESQISALHFNADGTRMVYARAAMDHPAHLEVVRIAEPKKPYIISHNDELLKQLNRPRPESVKVKVEGGEMQMWILKPPGFDATKKWPVVYLVHGGPQSAWEDGWSFRWNPTLWAAQGYVVACPNPRGSTGFGQKFVDEISSDWGGKCYRDLMAGADYVEKLLYVDSKRIAAAGASFGGYMMNWFAVNTGRFRTLITHCSVWNFESMWGTTDELWFDEYEHGGLPWDKPGAYAEFSPHKKAGNLGKFKTPMLIIHNDLDFRCPIGQGHELFSALQRQRVPSRFINFPDEGHWVTRPKNSQYWHQEVFDWLKKYNPPGGK